MRAPPVMPSSLPTGRAIAMPQNTGLSPAAPTLGMTTRAAVKAKTGRIPTFDTGSSACRTRDATAGASDQPERDAGDRRVHTRQMHEHPGRERQNDHRDHDRHGPSCAVAEPPERQHDGHRDQQRQRVQPGGEEQRDEQDGDEIVDHGQREKQGPHPTREPPTQDGEHPEGERDVGRRRDGPPAARGADLAR